MAVDDEFRSEMRDFRNATTASFVGLRQDVIDLRNQFDRGFAEMHGRIDETAAGIDQIKHMLQTFIADRPKK